MRSQTILLGSWAFLSISALALQQGPGVQPPINQDSSKPSSTHDAPLKGLPTPFPNRVASGDISQTSAVLWAYTKLAGTVRFEVALDESFEQIVQTLDVEPSAYRLPAKQRVGGLQPGTEYFYRASLNGGKQFSVGRFVTSHSPDGKYGLRFGISGDGRGDQLPFTSIANAPARELDFFAYIGDTIYADVASGVGGGIDFAVTRREYLAKHEEVISEVDGLNTLADLRASTGFYVTIDDHEVINDFSGGAHPSTDLRFDQNGDFINETDRYIDAMAALRNFYPVNPSLYGDTGDPRTAFKRKLYRYETFGQDAALILLDCRSFRDAPLEEADPSDTLSVLNFLAKSFDPTRTMLGKAQMDDLKSDLLDAQAKGVVWKFVVVPEPIQNLGVAAASDRFEGYAAERTEILSFVDDNDIDNVVFVAADIHGTVVNNVTYQLGPGQPQIELPVFEITTGAVAYDAPFGPTVVELAEAFGLLTQEQIALYNSLPLPFQDDFIEGLINENVVPLGYDPVGLQGSPIEATLDLGKYVATHTYGWTEFEIHPETSELTIVVYGQDPAALEVPPAEFLRFRVQPQ